jgi:hypothetical protein
MIERQGEEHLLFVQPGETCGRKQRLNSTFPTPFDA